MLARTRWYKEIQAKEDLKHSTRDLFSLSFNEEGSLRSGSCLLRSERKENVFRAREGGSKNEGDGDSSCDAIKIRGGHSKS